MQTMSARDAQTKFGQFSREAQRDTVVVTNHGQPVFLTIPVKITASVARMIREVSPRDGAEASQTLQDFFAHLNATQPANQQLDEAEISRMIKQGDNE